MRFNTRPGGDRSYFGFLAEPWAARIWTAVVFWQLSRFAIDCLVLLTVSPRVVEWRAFWTDPGPGGFSLLGLALATQLGFAAMSAGEWLYCFCCRSTPLRNTRIWVHMCLCITFVHSALVIYGLATIVERLSPV